VGQFAFEAGNSAQMVYRHYLKAVTETTARQWFAIMPNIKGHEVCISFKLSEIFFGLDRRSPNRA
jgi:hypothetical protein